MTAQNNDINKCSICNKRLCPIWDIGGYYMLDTEEQSHIETYIYKGVKTTRTVIDKRYHKKCIIQKGDKQA